MATPKGVRGLKDRPEPLQPAVHGRLWRLSKLLKLWEQRWYSLAWDGFTYSKSPQAILISKPVFPDGDGIKAVQPEAKCAQRGNQTLWGFTVQSSTGDSATMYCEDPKTRDAWVTALDVHVRGKTTQRCFLHERYAVDYSTVLGSGLFAVVLRATDLLMQMPVAIKVIKSKAYRDYRDMIQREVMVWHAVGAHPNIVKLHNVYYSTARVYFVAELLSGGSLVARLASARSYTEADVARLMRQLLSAVQHCHAQGIVHMDLKPENIVLLNDSPDSPIKVIDFSLASFFYTATEPGGTPEFVAPEVLLNPEGFADNGCGPSIDIWAAGVVMYYLLCGRTPFQAETTQDIIAAVKRGTWDFSPPHAWADISNAAKDMVSQMLNRTPERRPSAADLLNHSWLHTAATQQVRRQLLYAQQEFQAASQPGQKGSARYSWILRTGVLQATQAAAGAGTAAQQEALHGDWECTSRDAQPPAAPPPPRISSQPLRLDVETGQVPHALPLMPASNGLSSPQPFRADAISNGQAVHSLMQQWEHWALYGRAPPPEQLLVPPFAHEVLLTSGSNAVEGSMAWDLRPQSGSSFQTLRQGGQSGVLSSPHNTPQPPSPGMSSLTQLAELKTQLEALKARKSALQKEPSSNQTTSSQVASSILAQVPRGSV